MSTKKIFVLGANCFSGQDFIDLLLEEDSYQVTGISRSAERSEVFIKYKLRTDLSKYSYVQIDFNKEMDRFLALMDEEEPEYIVNFSALSEVAPSWESPEDWYQTNCVALARIVNHIRRRSYVKRYLHISSPEVYGTCSGIVKEDAPLNPSTPYAASKAAADMLLFTYFKQFKIPLLVVRATNVYGARQQLHKIIPRSAIYLDLGKKIELHGGGKAVKSFIHIRDVSNGELSVLERGEEGQIYHLSPDSGISIRDLVEKICLVKGLPFTSAVDIVAERPGQDAAYVIDSTRAREELGWLPNISIEEGLNEVFQWVEKYKNEISKLPLEYIHFK